MNNWKVWRLLLLLVLLGVFGWTLHTRGLFGRFGVVAPAALETDFKTERDWAIREIALDIEEMAAFADRRAARPLPQLPEVPWEPDAFLLMARDAFGDAAKVSIDNDVVEIYPALIAMDVPTLIESSKTVSQLLTANMRNAHAHESAALVLGAFALREAADLFTDVRWSLNRMTAHLAAAGALRQDDQRSPDGALANVILLALANHQARAINELGKLGRGAPPEPLNAWIRALHLRITQDWRALPEPSATSRLEKLEFFRARRAAVQRQRAMPQLERLGEPVAADFARIAQDSMLGVEDGHEFIMPALDLELDEAARAYQRIHGRRMPDSLPEGLNHRAGRLITGGPTVLPWGAWAQFFQRHIAMNMGMVDSHVRHMLGRHDRANEIKREFETRLGELTLFSIGTLRWTKGSEGTEADLRFLREMTDLTAEAPQLVPVRVWQHAEMGSRYEPVTRLMPVGADWFQQPTPEMPFEAGIRRGSSGDPEALLSAAPHDMALLIAMAPGDPNAASVKHARGLLAYHHDYDLRAVDASAKYLTIGSRDLLAVQQKGCAISSRDCLAVASTLLYWREDEAAAAREYERAFADPDMDAIARAGDSGWLTSYFYRTKQLDKAVALAEQVVRTGSGAGHVTHGRLSERLGILDKAEEDFMANVTAYDNKVGLLAFYYRRVEVDKIEAYRPKYERWLAEVFPQGLQPVPTFIAGQPQSGVFVYKDSAYSKKYGVRAGDIIVGLEGWKVDTAEQYFAINAFKDDPAMKLTLWRGQLVTIDAKSPTRLLGTELQTHPMKGWIRD
jgi:hypothetical protein